MVLLKSLSYCKIKYASIFHKWYSCGSCIFGLKIINRFFIYNKFDQFVLSICKNIIMILFRNDFCCKYSMR